MRATSKRQQRAGWGWNFWNLLHGSMGVLWH